MKDSEPCIGWHLVVKEDLHVFCHLIPSVILWRKKSSSSHPTTNTERPSSLASPTIVLQSHIVAPVLTVHLMEGLSSPFKAQQECRQYLCLVFHSIPRGKTVAHIGPHGYFSAISRMWVVLRVWWRQKSPFKLGRYNTCGSYSVHLF